MRVGLGLVALLVGAVATGGCGASDAAPGSAKSGPSTVAQVPQGSHTVLVVLENHELGEVLGASDAPYFNQLVSQGALAVNYHAITHPSLPNYLALAGGSTFGISEDCTDCLASGPSLATQLSAAGRSWRAYMGAMPSPCWGSTPV